MSNIELAVNIGGGPMHLGIIFFHNGSVGDEKLL